MTKIPKKKKTPNNQFVESWSMGMNDYEIAKQIGVKLDTLRQVKSDLRKDDKY